MGSSLSHEDLKELYGGKNIKIEDDIFYKIINGITVAYCCFFAGFCIYGVYSYYFI